MSSIFLNVSFCIRDVDQSLHLNAVANCQTAAQCLKPLQAFQRGLLDAKARHEENFAFANLRSGPFMLDID